jgi:hypothetical protein
MVMCGEISANETAELADCCLAHSAHKRRPRAAAAMMWGAGAPVVRADLDETGDLVNEAPDWMFGQCTRKLFAEVPAFYRDDNSKTQASSRGDRQLGLGAWAYGLRLAGASRQC